MPSKSHQTALSYLQAFSTLSPDSFLAILSPTATHQFAPSSISLPPALSPPAFAHHIDSLRHVLVGFPVTPTEIWADEANGQVTIWARSQTIFREEAKDSGVAEEEWCYRGEYIFVLTLDETRERVERVLEFVDSKGTEGLRGLMGRARRNVGIGQ